MGDRDEFTSVQKLHEVLSARSKGRTSIHIVEGGGHFELESPAFDGLMVQLMLKFMVDTFIRDDAQLVSLVTPTIQRMIEVVPEFTQISHGDANAEKRGCSGCV